MKKILFLTLMAIVAGCTCIGQIPDQLEYLDENCMAYLDDYTTQFTVTDNCDGVILQQFPEPGTELLGGNTIVEVTISARDINDNVSTAQFRVVVVDTIYPVLTPDTVLMYSMDDIGDLMKASHYYMAHAIQQAYEAAPDSAIVKYPALATWENVWDDYTMVTFYPKGGDGTYLGTFYAPGQYLCGCDSAAYYTQSENMITLNF